MSASTWAARPPEVRNLLNPAYCGLLLFEAIAEYQSQGEPISFELCYLILPLVLHKRTREALPRGIGTPLASWIDENPDLVAELHSRARDLRVFTNDALIWAGSREYIKFLTHGRVSATRGAFRSNQLPDDPLGEIKLSVQKARLLGRWFASAGQKEIIFMLFGLRP